VKKLLLISLVAALMLGLLSGCLSMGGRPRGPVDAFVFTSGVNPGLEQNVAGAINMQPSPLEITVVVPPGTNVRNLAATLSLNVEATITVVSSGERVVQENGVSRNDFSTPVMYSIEVPKEKKPWRYKVTVREADTNPRLAQVGIPEDSVLNPAFNPRVKSYTLKVPFATRQARIGARAESSHLKSMAIDGAASQGSSATAAIDFSSGQERSFIIETTAEDGVSREQYTFTLLRGEPDRNAALDGLEIGEASLLPAFSPQRQNYSAQVPYAAAQVVVRVRPQSKYATAALSAATCSGGARAVLPYKGNPVEKNGAVVEFTSLPRLPIIVTITAQDGSIREYLVEVVRAEPDRNNFLAALSVADGALSPGFVPNALFYITMVPYATKQLALTAQPQSRFARMALEPGPAAGGVMVPVKGDLASKEGAVIDFQAGDRVSLVVAVTAQDGNVLRYLLDIRRSPPDSNADLASLTVSAGVLSPVFSPRIVSYTVSLPAAAETVSLTMVAASKVATVSSELPLAQSGAAQLIIVPASPGKIVTVNIMVTAEDGSQKLYRINVSREGVPTGMPDANSRLAVLQVSGAPLTPPFNPAVTACEVKLPANVGSVVVNARAESPTAAITLDGQPLAGSGRTIAVAAGSTQAIALDVTAENGAVTRYTLKLTREGAPAAKPPAAGGILVLARDLQLGKREASALAQRVEALKNQTLITVRTYRTNDILAQVAAPIAVRVQRQNTVISLTHRLGSVAASPGRLIEVEVAIPTSGGRYLCYTEARPFDGELELEVPFLLLADNPRVSWPAIGTPVKVAGYLSSLPAGKDKEERAVDREDFDKNEKGEYKIAVEFGDPKTAKPLGKEAVWTKPGPGRGKRHAFGRHLELPEGSTLSYTLTATGKSGKTWQATGTTQVWTTMLSYDGGFAPALLFVADELK
jgi:hypothetical protein